MRAIALALFALLLCVSETRAEERIQKFTSDATIDTDGALTVRETIVWSFRNEGRKRGLLRDFPTRYKDRNGLNANVGFEVVAVKRNGSAENFVVESISNGKRVRIGSADIFLPEGRHTYEITYRTTHQIGYFDSYDELYWNVTGNAWTMPIDRAEAIIHLPAGARILQHYAYTGKQGKDGSDFRVTGAEGGVYRAETSGPLAPNEGFTVAVGFTKGILTAPTETDKVTRLVSDNASLGVMAASLVAVLAYFLWSWMAVGRDPPKGTIIPLFSPPPLLGPAGLRYVWTQKFDDKAFAASLVGLAVKGRLKITDDDGDYAIEKRADSGPPLLTGEAALYRALRPGPVPFKQANHREVRAMRATLEKALGSEFDGVAFVRNLGWSFAGLGLSVLGLLASVFTLPPGEAGTGLFMTVWTGGWWAVILLFLVSAIRGLFAKGVARKAGAVVMLLFLVPFILAGTAGPVLMLSGTGSWTLYALAATGVAMALLNVIFFRLMRAPTREGRRLLDQIEGFRMYMATAEEDRLNVLNPPEKTPELFEKYLPYAIALDCENQWADKFTAILAAAGIAAPAWYAGTHWNTGNMGGFTESLGNSLASSTAAASSPPGSSSGSGGGGSSGGGGGGGGGSSW